MTLKDYLVLPYPIVLRFDEDGDWVAEIEELEGCVAHGETQSEALSRLEEAKTLWIEEALSNGQPMPQPSPTEQLPSGKWLQRVPRSLHKNLARLSKIEGVSLNQLVATILSGYIGANGSKRPEPAGSTWHTWWSAEASVWTVEGAWENLSPGAIAYLRDYAQQLPNKRKILREELDIHVAKR